MSIDISTPRMTRSLRCDVVIDIADAETLRPAWTDLLERCDRNELTHSPDWLLTWWTVFGNNQGRQLRVICVHDGDRLVGLAPLLWRRHWYKRWLPFRRLELLASGELPEHGIYSNHIGILAERGAEAKVAKAVVAEIGAMRGWDEVVLPMMSADTPMPELLVEAFAAAGYRAESSVIAGAPYIPLPSTWREYLLRHSANGRRNLERSLKAFNKWADGTMELECITSPADVERGKAILMSLHHERWASADQAGVFRSPLFLDFHDRMMRLLAERDALELLILRARGEPMAALYTMLWAGKVIGYQTGRRMDLPPNVRPGGVLFTLAIRRAIELGRSEFDLQADEAPYKLRLTPHVRKLVQVRVARTSAIEMIRKAGVAGKHWLRQIRSTQRMSSVPADHEGESRE
ncbi:MAG TPA: GNAT family N-acetyltransferase [Gemmataceae bacterium]|nr:GNAT family N-acetyltransferase [Gemmataceae bacterium]